MFLDYKINNWPEIKSLQFLFFVIMIFLSIRRFILMCNFTTMYFISWLIIWYGPKKIYLKISIHRIATDFLFDRYSISVTRKIEFRGTEIDKMVQIDNGMSLSELYYCASALIIGWHFSEFYLCNQLVVQLHVTNNQSLVAYRNKKRVQSAMCGMLNSNQSHHANFIEHRWQNHYNEKVPNRCKKLSF